MYFMWKFYYIIQINFNLKEILYKERDKLYSIDYFRYI